LSRASDAANSVVYTAEQVCALYGVQVTREQSRMFNVQGTAGRWRPMFVGQWTDNFGKIHRAGKADLLARPQVNAIMLSYGNTIATNISVPLWIECKSGEGRMTPDQIAFKNWVESNGDAYLLLLDDVRPLIAWFDERGVEKHCSEADLKPITNPVDASILYMLPCKWCGLSRGEHIGVALGCPGKTRKVWSPDLRRAS
jgi:hypothetical protein